MTYFFLASLIFVAHQHTHTHTHHRVCSLAWACLLHWKSAIRRTSNTFVVNITMMMDDSSHVNIIPSNIIHLISRFRKKISLFFTVLPRSTPSIRIVARILRTGRSFRTHHGHFVTPWVRPTREKTQQALLLPLLCHLALACIKNLRVANSRVDFS